ncbi:MAG: hypothetical protein RSF40_04845 [Oscillospiraceae bacterium]
MNVVLSNHEGGNMVNTALPAVSVSLQNSMDAQVFIGGLICDRVKIYVSVIIDLENFALSTDNNWQVSTIDLSNSIRGYVEKCKQDGTFNILKQKYDFFPLYKGFDTYQTTAFRKEVGTEVMILELEYNCNVADKELYAATHEKESAGGIDITIDVDGKPKTTRTIPLTTDTGEYIKDSEDKFVVVKRSGYY